MNNENILRLLDRMDDTFTDTPITDEETSSGMLCEAYQWTPANGLTYHNEKS